jgi:hypothetical protein
MERHTSGSSGSFWPVTGLCLTSSSSFHAILQVSNQALADEKTRTDVLLARQYNLISLMAQQGMFGGGSSCGASALHEKTLGAWCTAAAAVVAAAADHV